MILETFRRTVEAHDLLAAKDRVLAGVSGGGDSVALLHLLARLSRKIPFDIVVAHVHHGLRGRAADEDQAFVQTLASDLHLGFLALRPDDATGPLLPGSGEEAMRKVRHALLDRAARENECDRVALAHTKDDQAETVLMRLLRGSGRRGLSGMRYAGPGRLIRPMLDIGRDEARAWVTSIGGRFREDETNADLRFLRNKVRAGLLPEMRRINPSAVDVLARTAEILQEEDSYLDELARQAMARLAEPVTPRADAASYHGDTVSARARGLAELPRPLARRVARLLLAAAGCDPRGARMAAVRQLLSLAGSGVNGDAREMGSGLRARLVEGVIEVNGPGSSRLGGTFKPFSVALTVPGRAELPGLDCAIEARLVACLDPVEARERPDLACLDAALLGSVVTVRSRLPGDRFHPLGARGGRKLKQFLIDRKVPRTARDRIPLVVGPSGIAWVVGQRIGHPYRLSGQTGQVAVLEVKVRTRVDLKGLQHII
jgi:tRNA(Ile)-lysidine synthase